MKARKAEVVGKELGRKEGAVKEDTGHLRNGRSVTRKLLEGQTRQARRRKRDVSSLSQSPFKDATLKIKI